MAWLIAYRYSSVMTAVEFHNEAKNFNGFLYPNKNYHSWLHFYQILEMNEMDRLILDLKN